MEPPTGSSSLPRQTPQADTERQVCAVTFSLYKIAVRNQWLQGSQLQFFVLLFEGLRGGGSKRGGGTRTGGGREEWEETVLGQELLKMPLQVSQGHWIKGSLQMNFAIRVRDLSSPK